MKNFQTIEVDQLELLSVKEGEKRVSSKRVDIVSIRMVKESSLMFQGCNVRSPAGGYRLFKQFLGELDREYMVVICLDVKDQPTVINICHIGCVNASIVHPREVMKRLSFLLFPIKREVSEYD